MIKFTSVEFMTATEKEKTVKAWDRFLKNYSKDWSKVYTDRFGNTIELPFKSFSKPLYNHLHLHCGYIAHYNILGFYHAQFSTPMDLYNNLLKFIDGIGWGGYQDIGDAMGEVAQKHLPAIKKMITDLAEERHNDSIAEAKNLLQSNGYNVATE